jgi:hypothetical protein
MLAAWVGVVLCLRHASRPRSVTAAFDQIEVGMASNDVEAILGGPEGRYAATPRHYELPPPVEYIGPDIKELYVTGPRCWEFEDGMVIVFFDVEGKVCLKQFAPVKRRKNLAEKVLEDLRLR